MPERGDLVQFSGGRWRYREEGPGGVLQTQCLHTGSCLEHDEAFHVHGSFTPKDGGPIQMFVTGEGGQYPPEIMEALRNA